MDQILTEIWRDQGALSVSTGVPLNMAIEHLDVAYVACDENGSALDLTRTCNLLSLRAYACIPRPTLATDLYRATVGAVPPNPRQRAPV
jgi:hypothetical protein